MQTIRTDIRPELGICDLAKAATNTATPPEVVLIAGVDVQWKFFFRDAAGVRSMTGVSELKLNIYGSQMASQGLIATQTATPANATLEQWEAGTHAHGVFLLSAAETNVAMFNASEPVWLVVHAVKSDSSIELLTHGEIRLVRGPIDGNPAESPVTLWASVGDLDAVEARVDTLEETATDLGGRVDALEAGGGGSSWSTNGNAISGGKLGTTNANSFAIITNDAVRATFTAAGRIGIGTATPASKLTLTGGGAVMGDSAPVLLIHSTDENSTAKAHGIVGRTRMNTQYAHRIMTFGAADNSFGLSGYCVDHIFVYADANYASLAAPNDFLGWQWQYWDGSANKVPFRLGKAVNHSQKFAVGDTTFSQNGDFVLKVGPGGPSSGGNQIVVAATITNPLGQTVNHSFGDYSTVNRNLSSFGYNSYDAVTTYDGDGTTEHWMGAQCRVRFWQTGGGIGLIGGYMSLPDITGGTVTNIVHFSSLGTSGTGGTVQNEIGWWIRNSERAASRAAIVAEGQNGSLFGAPVESVGVKAPAARPHASALVELQSTSKGLLLPRMTTAQMSAIASPATSLQVYDADENRPRFFDGAAWRTLQTVQDVENIAQEYQNSCVLFGQNSNAPGASGAPPLVYFGTATTWSASGTYLGVNAPAGFVGDFFRAMVNSVDSVRMGPAACKFLGFESSASALTLAGNSVTVNVNGPGDPVVQLGGASGHGVTVRANAGIGFSSRADHASHPWRDTVLHRMAPRVVGVTNGPTLAAGGSLGDFWARNIRIYPEAGVSPLANNEIVFRKVNNTTVRMLMRGDDGTVRGADLTLSDSLT